MTEKTKNDDIYEIPISNEDNDENEELMNMDENTPKQNAEEEQQLSEEEKVPEERDYINMIQRLKAEFENYKRRVRKEREELSDFVKRELIEKLLPVLDDFERMLDNAHKIDEAQLSGNKLVYTKLYSILRNEGLEPIESVGEEFDPEWHEAVVIEKGEDGEDNTVIEEWQKGYLFKSKLLRPSKVKVFKKE